jgi:dienelactone hydrolase
MKDREVRYRDGQVECVGLLVEPAGGAPAPAVAIVPAWDGRDAFVAEKAAAIAALGYVGFAVDVYGGGRTGSGPTENAKLMQPFLDDRAMLRRRLLAGIEALRSVPRVDGKRIAAMGYCFGGLCVLDLARAGTELTGVVSNHGLFNPPAGIANARIGARVLALHGWDDPMVPPDAVLAFAKEMTAAHADWQLHAYGNTLHAFTNPNANDRSLGAVYDAKADRRAWETTVNFLRECFV